MEEFKHWMRGRSQSWLAKQIGVSRMTVFNWLHGRCKPSPEHALMVEKVTEGQVKATSLIFGDDYGEGGA